MGSPGFSRYFSTVHGSRSLVFPTTSGRAYYRRPKGMVSLVHGRVLGGSPLSLKGQLPHFFSLSSSRFNTGRHCSRLERKGTTEREREKGRHPSSLRRGPSHPAARFARINTRHPNRSPSHPLFACAACLPACLPARLPKPAVQVSLENSNGLLPNPSTSRDAFQIVRHDYTTDCSTCHASWTPLSSNTRSIISRPTFSRGETRKKRD